MSMLSMKSSNRWLLALLLVLCFMLPTACGDDDDDNDNDDTGTPADDDATPGDDDDDDDDDNDDDDDDDNDDDTVPDDIVDPPDQMPFFIERDPVGEPLTPAEIATFSEDMRAFFADSDYFRWAVRHSFGVNEQNEWDEPPYMIWWTNSYAEKSGDLVTFTFHEPPDNTTAKVTRVLTAAIGDYLTAGDEAARELALGYMRGLSATYDGFVFGDEDPALDTLMARTIFHRNQTYTLDGGRQVAVDYEPVRFEVFARRHDTIHNPNNPTWGDLYVRNKRSKDDFPYLYRDVPLLARLIRESGDPEMRQAAIKLYRQIVAMTQEIIDQGYRIRTKGVDGEAYIPRTDAGLVDDFASFVNFSWILPCSECNARLATAYLATGTALDNTCGDGYCAIYENIAILERFWPSNMNWGNHISALSLALAFGDNVTARELLDGLGSRMDLLASHPFIDRYVEWYPDLAQLLVLAAAYGLPLTNEEARLVQEQYGLGADHYNTVAYWDLWDASVPDGEYDYIPDRYVYDDKAVPTGAYVRITEIGDLYEYCHSPLKDPNGAQFIDCEAFLAR
jgi:hypothetical protein